MAYVELGPKSHLPEAPMPHLEVEERASRSSVIARLVLVLPALAGLAALVLAIAWQAVAEPVLLSRMAEQLDVTLRIGFGLTLCTALLLWPARNMISRLWTRRRISIGEGVVVGEEHGLRRVRRWSEPVAAYRGVAHHIRASLSGVSHEIVLVHDNPARNVTLHAAPTVAQGEIDALAARLGLPEIPARALYERRARDAHVKMPTTAPSPA